MASGSFFDDQAKAAVRGAIERIESQTSAEVVVTVHRQAGRYRDADLLFGAIVALVVLCVLLFAEHEFDTRYMPLDVIAAFGLAALFCAYTPTLRRLFVPGPRRAENARRAACASFHEQKIARTTGRNGILVFVAMFERKASIVYDLGIDPEVVGAAFSEAIARIERSVEHLDPKVGDFVSALEALGPALATAMPRQEDDVNELPDEVGTA